MQNVASTLFTFRDNNIIHQYLKRSSDNRFSVIIGSERLEVASNIF